MPEELIKAERRIKKFKRYTIGYLQLDTLYTPKIDKQRWYVYTAIDRVSKLAFLWVSRQKTKEMGVKFFKDGFRFLSLQNSLQLTEFTTF